MGLHDQMLQFYQYNIMIVDLCSTVTIKLFLSSSLSFLYYKGITTAHATAHAQLPAGNCAWTVVIPY